MTEKRGGRVQMIVKKSLCLTTGFLLFFVICFTVMGCKDTTILNKPVFAKVFEYEEGDTFDIIYYCDKKWEKEIKRVSLPEIKGAECIVEDIAKSESLFSREMRVFLVCAIQKKGISSKSVTQKSKKTEGTSWEPNYLTIKQIEVEWDDGTSETIDIGRIVLFEPIRFTQAKIFDGGTIVYGNKGVFHSVWQIEYQTPCKIKLFEGTDIEPLLECFEEMKVNDVSLGEMAVGTELLIDNNGSMEITMKQHPDHNPQYDYIKVLLQFRCYSDALTSDTLQLISIWLDSEQ